MICYIIKLIILYEFLMYFPYDKLMKELYVRVYCTTMIFLYVCLYHETIIFLYMYVYVLCYRNMSVLGFMYFVK